MAKKKVVAPWEVTADMFLSEAEVADLLQYVRNTEQNSTDSQQRRTAVDRLIIELLLMSGLRNSELCRLRVADTIVGHGQSALHVSSQPKEERFVHIPQSLSGLIRHYVQEIRPEYLNEGQSAKDLSQPLILNERGKAYDRTALYRRVVRILTEAGLEDRASVQLLRHTYGFLAYKRTGGNLLFVQQQLGHAHPMVTAVYAQFVEFSYPDLADQVAGEPTSATPGELTLPKLKQKSSRKNGTVH